MEEVEAMPDMLTDYSDSLLNMIRMVLDGLMLVLASWMKAEHILTDTFEVQEVESIDHPLVKLKGANGRGSVYRAWQAILHASQWL